MSASNDCQGDLFLECIFIELINLDCMVCCYVIDCGGVDYM